MSEAVMEAAIRKKVQLLQEMNINMSFEANDMDSVLYAVEQNRDTLRRLKQADTGSGKNEVPDELQKELENLLKKNILLQKQLMETIALNKERMSCALQEISKRKLVERNYVSARTEPLFVDKDFL